MFFLPALSWIYALLANFWVLQGLQGAVGLRQHFHAVMREKKAIKSNCKSSSVELKAAQADLSKTIA